LDSVDVAPQHVQDALQQISTCSGWFRAWRFSISSG
jgi:hypothetical protein